MSTVKTDIPIHGTCDAAYKAIEEVFRENFATREEVGAAVCVYRDGEKVVDLWGGYADKERTQPWEENTIVIMHSIAKSMCALCVHTLIDKGLVDLEAPVAAYWPEFAQAGKEKVLVRHAISHSCGVIFNDAAPKGSWFDYPAHVKAIEVQEPAWEPGTEGAYNSINIGFILGEIVRRVSGKTIGTFLREEVTGPLGADYNIGLRPDEAARVSDTIFNPENGFWKRAQDPTLPLARAQHSKPDVDDMQNSPQMREGELPSFGGHGNARAMARIYGMLACGGEIGGVRILSEAYVRGLPNLQWEKDDQKMVGRYVRMGLGFWLNEPTFMPMGKNMSAFGHPGSGGAVGYADPERRLSFSYSPNFQREGVGMGIRCTSLMQAAAEIK
ncbi:MAG: serine hydrolase [bacterium]|nr:serine hydrolase [bacterium]